MVSRTDDEVVYPLPQPKGLQVAAKILSYIFHPLFIPAYVAAYLIYLHPYTFAGLDEKQKFIRLISVFIITAFFPALTVFLLWRLKFADSIFLRTQKERIIPYVASIIYFFWAFFVSRNMPGSPAIMTVFFLGVFLSASGALMLNSYFKISMHAIAVAGAAMFMLLIGTTSIYPMGIVISIATIVAGMVCTARLIVSDHHPMEVYWGILIGALGQVIGFLYIM